MSSYSNKRHKEKVSFVRDHTCSLMICGDRNNRPYLGDRTRDIFSNILSRQKISIISCQIREGRYDLDKKLDFILDNLLETLLK